MKQESDNAREEHDWASLVLPWLVNETLPAADVRRLRAHLQICRECSRDLEIEEGLARRLAAAPVVDYAPQAALARMNQRIDSAQASGSWLASWRRRSNRATGGRRTIWVVAFAVQAAALVLLAVTVVWQAQQAPGEYRTLSSSPAQGSPHAPAQPHLQVVFADAVTAADMRATLARVRGRIVSGPSRAGVFLVTIESPGVVEAGAMAEIELAARTLAREPGVRFVAVQRAPTP